MKFNATRKTILASNDEQTLSADHPLFYVRERNKYLDRLTHQTNTQSQLPTIDLRRNMRIDHYIDKYNQLHAQQLKQKHIDNAFLPTSSFRTIFQNQQEQLTKVRRQQKKMQKMQQQLYQNYIEQANIYQKPQHDVSQQKPPETILQMGSKNKMRELYLLDLQIGKLKQQEELQKISKQRSQSCRNMNLVSKLSTSLISSYLVYFDQIVTALLDELLQDEVLFLNHLEADYRVHHSYKSPLPSPQTQQTLQMMELVRSLNDLCDS